MAGPKKNISTQFSYAHSTPWGEMWRSDSSHSSTASTPNASHTSLTPAAQPPVGEASQEVGGAPEQTKKGEPRKPRPSVLGGGTEQMWSSTSSISSVGATDLLADKVRREIVLDHA